MAPRGASKKKTSSTKSTVAKKSATSNRKSTQARGGARTTSELKPKKKGLVATAKGTKPAKPAKKSTGKSPSSSVSSFVQKAQSYLPTIPGVSRWISKTVG
ncbi:MAG TPA: hypothetical protein VIS07_04165 [Candidatus Binatia bacterium]